MSAVLTNPSALLRRPQPPAATAPARPLRLRLTGTLLEDAYASVEPATGRAAFTVVLRQGAGDPVVIATRWVGDGPEAAFFASERAAQLRAGDTVQVHGEGMRMRYHHGAMAVSVAHTFSVEIPSVDGSAGVVL